MELQSLIDIYSKKPERRDTTNKAYAQRILGLAKRFGRHKEETYTDWTFLKNKDEVLEFIMTAPTTRRDKNGEYPKPSPTTQIGYLNPIIELLLLVNEYILAEEYNEVKKVIDDKIQKTYQKKGGLTEAQKQNVVSYEDLVNYCDLIDKEIQIYENKLYMSHLDEWHLRELHSMKILMRLYLLHPSRNEYATLKFITLQDFKKIKEPEYNYVVIGTKKSYLSITNYKTSKLYGRKFQEITDKPLLKMLKDLKKIRDTEDRDHLFYLQKTGEPWDNNNLCAVMTKHSKKLLDKNIGSTLIYKIVIEEAGISYNEAMENDDIVNAVKFNEILAKFAKSRGHSQKIQKLAYIKD
jgi:hypothetical protein